MLKKVVKWIKKAGLKITPMFRTPGGKKTEPGIKIKGKF